MIRTFVASAVITVLITMPALGEPGARVVSYYGYDDCIELANDQIRAVLCPAAGGRVLEYSLAGENALYLPPGDEGWTWSPGSGGGRMNAGRFDIGPEQMIPPRKALWMGRWRGEITGPRAARLTSPRDESTGVQLVREFVLDEQSSELACTQRIINVSDQLKEYCHWSRTFAVGGGIAVVPRSHPGRFPHGYLRYGEGAVIEFRPEDPNIIATDDYTAVIGPPKSPKLGFDSHAGWMAYYAPSDLLFVKAYPTFPHRYYNEVAALTASVWYPDGPMCELEPIGPAERLRPGESAEFTERWYLGRAAFPTDRNNIDFRTLQSAVAAFTSAAATP